MTGTEETKLPCSFLQTCGNDSEVTLQKNRGKGISDPVILFLKEDQQHEPKFI